MTPTALFIATLALSPVVVLGQFDGSRHAWYTSDAANKFENALPIGNGRLGAMVFGGNVEKVVLNENSMWSGPWQDRVNKNARGAADDIWKKLLAGSITAAGQAAMSNLAGDPTSPRAYQPLVNLGADFGHGSLGSNYTRWLDTLEGTVGVNYTLNGVTYSREYVASYPHGVLAFRFSASTPGKLAVKLSLSRDRSVTAQTASAARGGSDSSVVSLNANSGQSSGAINFWSEARVVNSGGETHTRLQLSNIHDTNWTGLGTVSSDGKTVSITGADSVDVFFNAETSYRYPDASQAQAELKRKLETAVTAGFPSVKAAAIQDFTSLISRTKLDIGSSGNAGTLPIPTRLTNFRRNPEADPQLTTLLFNFGRHALVSSSRDTGPKSLPANLQGIWNQDYSPPWQSKYTININLEMNYWPALVTNLAETQKPVFDLLAIATPRAQAVAKAMYNCDGMVLHHNTDLWGDSAPVDKGTPYTIWPMGAAWLSHDMMEHYHFGLNRTFLRTTVFPTLAQTARFFFCHLREWNSYWTVAPSLSPEHAFLVPSGTGLTQANKAEGLDLSIEMDNQLLRQLFTNILTACSALNLTTSGGVEEKEICDKAGKYLPRIRPPGISTRTGRILEWRTDYPEQEAGHRHFSPLFGLYPAWQLTSNVNATLSAAGKKLVDHRISSGSGSTGWSRAWAVNIYARLGEGDTALKHAQEFIKKYPTGNLFGSDGGSGTAFQIDGTFGLVSGLAEMLVQSHGGTIHLLPAIPGAWKKGRVEGLVGRGGFVVDIEWEGGQVKAMVTSKEGGMLDLKVGGKKGGVSVDGKVVEGPVATVKGGRYDVRGSL